MTECLFCAVCDDILRKNPRDRESDGIGTLQGLIQFVCYWNKRSSAEYHTCHVCNQPVCHSCCKCIDNEWHCVECERFRIENLAEPRAPLSVPSEDQVVSALLQWLPCCADLARIMVNYADPEEKAPVTFRMIGDKRTLDMALKIRRVHADEFEGYLIFERTGEHIAFSRRLSSSITRAQLADVIGGCGRNGAPIKDVNSLLAFHYLDNEHQNLRYIHRQLKRSMRGLAGQTIAIKYTAQDFPRVPDAGEPFRDQEDVLSWAKDHFERSLQTIATWSWNGPTPISIRR